MEKSNDIIQRNEVVIELNSILKDLDTVITRVYSVVRLVLKQERDNQARISNMQDELVMLLTKLDEYRNGKIQDN